MKNPIQQLNQTENVTGVTKIQPRTVYFIPVHRDHIDNGTIASPEFCMVARAVRDKFPEAEDIAVTYGSVSFKLNGKHVLMKISDSMTDLIAKFDRGMKKALKPFGFFLTLQEDKD